MDPEPAQDPNPIIRTLERMRRAPVAKRRVYALAFAAGTTLVFVGVALAWRVVAGGGEEGSLASGFGELLAAIGGVFRGSAGPENAL
jgi:hypothetical protein